MPAIRELCDQFLPQICSGRNFENELRPQYKSRKIIYTVATYARLALVVPQLIQARHCVTM